jgi:hypothetical protein
MKTISFMRKGVVFCILHFSMVLAQNTGAISGTLLDAKQCKPPPLWLSAFKTVVSHKFPLRTELSIYCNPCRRTVNFFKTQSYKEALYPVTITSGESIDLGVIFRGRSVLPAKYRRAYSRTT